MTPNKPFNDYTDDDMRALTDLEINAMAASIPAGQSALPSAVALAALVREMHRRATANSQEWGPSDTEACENCARVKHTTLEMIGPTTGRTCLDCQKIPPAHRDRAAARRATEDEYKAMRSAGIRLTVAPFGLSFPGEVDAMDRFLGRTHQKPHMMQVASITGPSQQILETVFYAIDGAMALCETRPENSAAYASSKQDLDRLVGMFKTLGGTEESLKYSVTARRKSAEKTPAPKTARTKTPAPKTPAPKTARTKKT